MITRPEDENGDMMPVWEIGQMLSGSEAVSQHVTDTLLIARGEWWEDDELGVMIPEYLASTITSGNIWILANYISGYIAKQTGVLGVDNVDVSLDGHTMIYSCTIITREGNANLEVGLNGLL